ncbi:hypothetical protein Tco_0870467, partial [Tanacetum coccineum]
MDNKTNQSNPPTPEKPPVSPISSYSTIKESSYPTIEESVEEQEYLTEGGLTEDELHQLAKDEEALKEVLEEEAKREKENAIYNKKLEEYWKEEQAHDELFRMKFGEICISNSSSISEEIMSKILNRRWTLMNPDTKVHQIKVSTSLKTLQHFGKVSFSNDSNPSLGENVKEWHKVDQSSSPFYIVRDDLLHPLVNGNKAMLGFDHQQPWLLVRNFEKQEEHTPQQFIIDKQVKHK